MNGHLDTRKLSVSILPGLYGGIVAVAVTLLLRSFSDTRLLAEIVVDASTQGLQPRGFSFLISTLGGYGKPLLFLSVLLTQVLLYTIAWQFSVRLFAKATLARVAAAAALISTGLLLVASVLLVGFSAAGLGSQTTWFGYTFVLAIASTAFALAAAAILRASVDVDFSESRRGLLQLLPLLLIGGAAIVVAGRRIVDSAGGGAQASSSGKPTPEVTSNEDFYVVSKNLLDPTVSSRNWRLRVGGASRDMIELRYEDIVAMPSRDQYATLQCVSNEVGGNLMGNALWTGFPLRDLIQRVQPLPSARFVTFRSVDDYTESLPLDFAMNEGVMLVHAMNGEPLPDRHGFPLRLLAPGKYGIKHPKWITEIGLVDAEFFGYWQKRDWVQEARMNTSTRIDVPRNFGSIESFPYRVHGVAFAGDRGIRRVEVSVDGGDTWADATLTPALSPYTWVLWYYDWTGVPSPSGQDRAFIFARSSDGSGDVQTALQAPPYPAGATGYPRVVGRLNLS